MTLYKFEYGNQLRWKLPMADRVPRFNVLLPEGMGGWGGGNSHVKKDGGGRGNF